MFNRILAAASCLAVLSTGTATAVHAAPVVSANAGGKSVVFIVPGQTVGAAPYGPLARALRKAGHDVHVLNLAGEDIAGDARKIQEQVQVERAAKPQAQISLVGHSAGGVSARYFLKVLGGSDYVANYVAIGSAQYGSPLACLQGGAARGLCPTSDIMKALNSGDDTPGRTMYYLLRSEKEWADGRLDGGQCRLPHLPLPAPFVNGSLHHAIEPLQPATATAVASALEGGCKGQFVSEPIDSIKSKETLFPNGF